MGLLARGMSTLGYLLFAPFGRSYNTEQLGYTIGAPGGGCGAKKSRAAIWMHHVSLPGVVTVVGNEDDDIDLCEV